MIIKKRPVTYVLENGELPEGLKFDPATGKISGLVNPNLFLNTPVWDTEAGRVGAFNEGDEIEPIELTAHLPEDSEATSFTYNIVEGFRNTRGLPWGLVMNATTGTITGTIGNLRDPLALSWLPEEEPKWTTPKGKLGTFGELDVVSGVFIEADGYEDRTLLYSITVGSLPWGLVLNERTGELHGNLKRLNTTALDIVFTPKPLWLTPPGAIISVDEKTSVDATIAAAPRLGTKLDYKIIEGGLPWGLRLNKDTGKISGTTASIKIPVKMESPDYAKPRWRTPPGRVGLTYEYDSVNIQLEVIPFENRKTYLTVVSGTLPLGMLMTNDGLIYGNAAQLGAVPAGYTPRPKPTWQTNPGSLGSFDEADTFETSILATPNLGSDINYKIIEGKMPWGLRLDSSTGLLKGKISDNKYPEFLAWPENETPTWQTYSEAEFRYNELDEVDIQLEAKAFGSRTLNFSITSGSLPWGAILQYNGQITGTLAVLDKIPEDYFVEPKPLWETASGNLGTTDEQVDVSYTIAANSRSNTPLTYKLIDGKFPFGLRLNQQTGVITGKASIRQPHGQLDVDNPPVFAFAPDTQVADVVRGQPIAYTVVATAAANRSLTYQVIRSSSQFGTLPLGAFLDPVTGVLSGTISLDAVPGMYEVNTRALDSAGGSTDIKFKINIRQETP